MDSIAPAAEFAVPPVAPHDHAAIKLSESLARATEDQLQRALLALNDDLLGTLSSYANAICQDRMLMRSEEAAA